MKSRNIVYKKRKRCPIKMQNIHEVQDYYINEYNNIISLNIIEKHSIYQNKQAHRLNVRHIKLTVIISGNYTYL